MKNFKDILKIAVKKYLFPDFTDKRAWNYSAGPSALPIEVLQKAQEELLCYDNAGMSILEISHRGKIYEAVHNGTIYNIRALLNVPDDYKILLLPGGASFQFHLIAANFGSIDAPSAYIHTGYWAKKAIAEAQKTAKLLNIPMPRIIWSGEKFNFSRVPAPCEIDNAAGASYIHICSNETIGGVEFNKYPDSDGSFLIADMSSNIMTKKLPFNKIAMVYAGAQKNLGPAGIAIAIISDNLLERANKGLPDFLSYKVHAEKNSLYNTPPVFAIYLMKLYLDWMLDSGGICYFEDLAEKKSKIVYGVIDSSNGFYSAPAEKLSRSRTNIVWKLPSPELEKKFLLEASQEGFVGLNGHRSVGGCRASLYNAMPMKGASRLASFMIDFKKKN